MKFTYGKKLAAQKLAAMVDNNPPARRKIMRLFSRYNEQLLQIVRVQDPETAMLLMNLLKDYNLKRINILKIDDAIKSYVENVVISQYRIYLHIIEEMAPAMRQKMIREKEMRGCLTSKQK